MSTSFDSLKKTPVNRIFLFLIIGFTSIAPLLYINDFFVVFWNSGAMPLGVLVVLVLMLMRENRMSEVKPKLLELFLAALGALYPSVLVAVLLWLVWWVMYGIFVLFGWEGGMYLAAYTSAGNVFGLLSLGAAIYLVWMNWRHVGNQLYPSVGTHSAFALISKSGKTWLLKRGIIFSIIFFITFVIAAVSVEFSEGENITIGDEFILSLFIVILYLYFVSITAWLWLRKPEVPHGIDFTNQAISRFLKPLGYEVQKLTELKNMQNGAIDEQMVASVDLIASKESHSLVIDVMTAEETHYVPDWVIASEFRMAVWYLKNVLQLPSPVEAVAVLVDINADESMFRFAEDQNINVIQLSNDEVVGLMTEDLGNLAFQKNFPSLFASIIKEPADRSTLKVAVSEEGGRHG